jgi:hypothetical protein
MQHEIRPCCHNPLVCQGGKAWHAAQASTTSSSATGFAVCVVHASCHAMYRLHSTPPGVEQIANQAGTHTALCCKHIRAVDLLVIWPYIGLARWTGECAAGAQRFDASCNQGELGRGRIIAWVAVRCGCCA